MTRQAAVDKLVKYLETLGYTALSAVDLKLVVDAISTFRSSKAAARYVCAVLGGRGNCLAPLASIEVRRTTTSLGPATRIPSPEEIELQARFQAASRRLKPVAKTPIRLPRLPKPVPPPKKGDTPKQPVQRAALSMEEQSVLRDERINTSLLQASETRLAELRSELASATGDRKKTLARDEKRLKRNLEEQLAQRKRIAAELAQLAKARNLSPSEFLDRFRPSPCGPSEEAAVTPSEQKKTAKAEARALAKRAESVRAQQVRTETKLHAATVTAHDKRQKPSARRRADTQANKLTEQAADLARERSDVERQLRETAAAAGSTAEAIVESQRTRKAERKARQAARQGAAEDEKRQMTMERAKEVVAQTEMQSRPKVEEKAAAVPSSSADDGTKLVNQLAAGLLSKKK